MTLRTRHSKTLILLSFAAFAASLALSACGGDDGPTAYPCGDTYVPACSPGGQRLSCEAGVVTARDCPAGSTCGMGLCCPTVANARVVNDAGACAYSCAPGTTNQGTTTQPNCVVTECTVDACHGGQLMRCDPVSHRLEPPTDCPKDQLCAPAAASGAGASCAPRDDFVLSTVWEFRTTDVAVVVRDPDPALPPSSFDLDCDGDGEYERTALPAGHYLCKNPMAPSVKISLRGYIQRLNWGDTWPMGASNPPTNVDEIEQFSLLLDITAWGKNPWRSTEKMFSGHGEGSFKMSAQDGPNLSQVASVAMMFAGSGPYGSKEWDLRSWNVRPLTSARMIFRGAGEGVFNLRGWDTAGITDMSHMFASAHGVFLADDWDTSNVVDMTSMFAGMEGALMSDPTSESFSGNNWDVSNVTSMAFMFSGVEHLAANLSSWDVSKVKTMAGMFQEASITGVDDEGKSLLFNLKPGNSVTNLESMFEGATDFNGDISEWDVSKVTNMSSMFFRARKFIGKASDDAPHIFTLKSGNAVNNMRNMFDGADAFNGDISGWDVSKVTNMAYMFRAATAFNGDLSKWDVSKVENMASMFSGAEKFNGDLSKWDVSRVTDMSKMFLRASAFVGMKADASRATFVLKSGCAVTNLSYMFSEADVFNGDVSDWDVSKVENMASMFSKAVKFNGDLSKWDVSKVVSMNEMFASAEAFQGFDLFNGSPRIFSLKTGNVVSDTAGMFASAIVFNGLVGGWDVSQVMDMSRMFYNAQAFKGDLSGWKVQAGVKHDEFATGADYPNEPAFGD